MNSTYTNPSGRRELPPPVGTGEKDPAKLIKWVDDQVYYTSPLRARDHRHWRKADLYDQSIQWLQRAYGEDGAAEHSQWVALDPAPNTSDWFPIPVLNEGFALRVNESARLSKPEFRPTVVVQDESNIAMRLAAQNATRSLRHRLREMGWPKQQERMALHLPNYGQAWIKGEWVQTWDQTIMVPLEHTQICQGCMDESAEGPGVHGEGCGFKMASKTLDMRAFAMVRGDFKIYPSFSENMVAPTEDGEYGLNACPVCGGALGDYSPTMEEANEEDAFGRKMGEPQPVGDWLVSVRSPYDVFPRNLGYDMDHSFIDEWAESHVETLDWVALRFPEKAGRIEPEKPSQLAKFHPVAGAPDISRYGNSAKMFRDSVRVKEWHKHPWMEMKTDEEGNVFFRYNRGRSVVAAGREVLLDGPYMLESLTQPGTLVERVWMECPAWELVDGGQRAGGQGLWAQMFDAQDGVNETASQRMSTRQRGMPKVKVPRQCNLEVSGLQVGVPYAIWNYDDLGDGRGPEIIANDTADPGVAAEQEMYTSFLNRVSNRAEVEKGNAPPNVSAASALALLKESSSEVRAPRIRRIKEALERIYSHGMRLMAALYIEPREYRYKDEDDGEEHWGKAEGVDFQGQTNVEIEVEAGFDTTMEKKETVRDLINSGVMNPATEPRDVRRKIARVLGAPDDLTQGDDIQTASSQREWYKYRHEDRVPVVDPSLDDHEIHYQEHGQAAQSEYFRDMEDRSDWDGALLILGGSWEEMLDQALMPPEPQIPPEVLAAAQAQGLPPPVMPQQRPLAPQDAIVGVWADTLARAGFESPDPDAFAKVLAWRAHMEGHALAARKSEMAQQAMQQPQMAAPGGDVSDAEMVQG